MKILAVDDDPLVLKILEQMLHISGFNNVTLAGSAVEAAQIIAEADPPFECFIFDIRMPEIEGDYLCHWVRHLPYHASTPIVMATALAKKSDIDRAFAAGASDYITKPIDQSDLDKRIRQIEHKIAQNGFEAPKNISFQGQQQDGLDRVDFTKPMHLGGINGEIDLQSLENYLIQLSRTGIHDMDAFSFAIQDAAKLHFICSRNEYLSILKTTGKMISKYLAEPGFFLSYAGYGAFTGVIRNADFEKSAWETLERKVQDSLKKICVPSKTGAPIRVEPHASMPLKLSVWSASKSIDILYRVIIEAEARCRPLPSAPMSLVSE